MELLQQLGRRVATVETKTLGKLGRCQQGRTRHGRAGRAEPGVAGAGGAGVGVPGLAGGARPGVAGLEYWHCPTGQGRVGRWRQCQTRRGRRWRYRQYQTSCGRWRWCHTSFGRPGMGGAIDARPGVEGVAGCVLAGAGSG